MILLVGSRRSFFISSSTSRLAIVPMQFVVRRASETVVSSCNTRRALVGSFVVRARSDGRAFFAWLLLLRRTNLLDYDTSIYTKTNHCQSTFTDWLDGTY